MRTSARCCKTCDRGGCPCDSSTAATASDNKGANDLTPAPKFGPWGQTKGDTPDTEPDDRAPKQRKSTEPAEDRGAPDGDASTPARNNTGAGASAHGAPEEASCGGAITNDQLKVGRPWRRRPTAPRGIANRGSPSQTCTSHVTWWKRKTPLCTRISCQK